MKVSAVLADYGFSTLRLTDDWQGANFIAQHIDGETFLKVQLKGRAVIDRKYEGKALYVAFPASGSWYLYPHDVVMRRILTETRVGVTESWNVRGGYSFPSMSKVLFPIIEPYRVPQAE